jgi:CPA2 family monovalent cation:H+ antiporter-2
VRAIAIPGAVAQIAIATLLGIALSYALGWTVSSGLVFGLALSVASTVVLLRAMQERRLIETDRGRIAVGWLIVEDIAMVVALVLLPPLAGLLKQEGGTDLQALVMPLALTFAKLVGFVALMLIVGRRVIPWVLHYVAHTGSRELFRLSVLAIALGVAYGSAMLFDVSFALGAFFAGMILSESELSQRAANETLPLRDAFAVLFFVSVGMLFDPMIMVKDWAPVIATVLIIVIGKSAAAYAIVRAFRHSHGTAMTISASLAQIGEFSFILASLGVGLGLLSERGRDLILAGAMISIMINPLVFSLLDQMLARDGDTPEAGAGTPGRKREGAHEPLPVTSLIGHVVLVGHGRVGSYISEALGDSGQPLLVIDSEARNTERARQRGIEAITGNAAAPEVIAAANLPQARCLLVAIPDAFEGGQVVLQGRQLNATLAIIARAHSDAEVEHLYKHGATDVIMAENEIGKAMIADIPPEHVPPAGLPQT